MPTDEAGQQFLALMRQQFHTIACPSGLLYEYIERGHGTSHPLPDTPCDFHYRGTLIDGTEFDSSFKRGQPSEFTANGVVSGCREGYQLMVEGDKVMFYIPSELAYGDEGVGAGLVPPGAVLVFEVHLLKIKGPSRPATEAATLPQLPAAPPAQAPLPQQTSVQPQISTQVQRARLIPKTYSGGTYEQPQVAAQQQASMPPQAYTQPQTVAPQQVYAQHQAFAQPQMMQPSVGMQPMAFAQPQVQMHAQRPMVGHFVQPQMPVYR